MLLLNFSTSPGKAVRIRRSFHCNSLTNFSNSCLRVSIKFLHYIMLECIHYTYVHVHYMIMCIYRKYIATCILTLYPTCILACLCTYIIWYWHPLHCDDVLTCVFYMWPWASHHCIIKEEPELIYTSMHVYRCKYFMCYIIHPNQTLSQSITVECSFQLWLVICTRTGPTSGSWEVEG